MKILNRVMHLSLFVISSYMSVLMFILIGNNLPTKLALASLAFILEATKLGDLHKAHHASKGRAMYISSYVAKALLSIFASVGLVLTLLSVQDTVASANERLIAEDLSAYEQDVVYWEGEIIKIDETISLLNENLDRNPEGYGLASKSFVAQIERLQDRKLSYRERYSTAVTALQEKLSEVTEQDVIVNPSDMFNMIGGALHVDDQILRIIVFVSIMILIEASLALTSFGGQPEELEIHSSAEKTESISCEDGERTIEPRNASLPPKALRITKAIAHKQAGRENAGQRLLTQGQLAEQLETTSVIINNAVRRYVKPLMRKFGVSSYSLLMQCLDA